ncbi:hypothetical protein AV656_05130 [Bhargavaea cecembensis]|uniref:Uncharacterized protein n=1 Tax=Bhargavaea cecembensis TaxID=394098 RepID=A0A165GZN0_9BACL|nr:hypothetical protein [Bhargavaea cecembensis]KZE38304.1 hypothetical protein AV656_05130 [Bhargavaea cecembensis]
MGSRRKLDGAVAHVRRRLMMEWLMRTAVRGLAAGAVSAVLLLAASRLFIWPGYAGIAGLTAILAAAVVFIQEWRRAPTRLQSVRTLDAFCRDNVILAAETDGSREGPLSEALSDAAAEASSAALTRFRKRKGQWTERRPLLIAGGAAAVVAVLSLFPSSAQLEAQEADEEREIIDELADNVSALEERTDDPGTEKRLAELAEEIRSADSPEEAVREAVKLQRELSLEERFSERPESGPGQTSGERILTPGEAAAALAALSGDAEEQLARMGRTSGTGNHASSGEEGAGSRGAAQGQEGTSPGGDGEPGAEGEENSSSESGGGSESNGGEAQDGDGNGTESGNGGDGISGTGTGPGNNDGGSGSGGSGQGSGDGDRNLVSTPQSPPEPGDQVMDPGPQKEGLSAADSLVPAERGEVRPYEEVKGEYRDAFVEHAGRLGLPEDLQQVLSDYFSSIDTRE